MLSYLPTIILAAIVFFGLGLLLSIMILLTKRCFVNQGPCALTINNDVVKKIDGGETLLTSLLGLGFSVPSPCGGKATCLQCKVCIPEGGGEILDTDKATFTAAQLNEGWRLSCQCKVKNDLKIELPQSQIASNSFTARVVSNHNVATFIKELIVEVPSDVDFAYIPGDYFLIKVPSYKTNSRDWQETIDFGYHSEWEKYRMFDRKIDFYPIEKTARAFSCASYPDEKGILKFNIRIACPPIKKNGKIDNHIPWGVGSTFLFSLIEGDTIELSGPHGESHMIDDGSELVFLIGGAGSSFGRSHILHLLESENSKRPISLWYGARSLMENIYEEDFKNLVDKYENFTYNVVLSEPLDEDVKSGWPKDDPVKTNFVFKAFELGKLMEMEAPEKALFYVCGPPLHNSSVIDLLEDYGVPRDQIILDDFGN